MKETCVPALPVMTLICKNLRKNELKFINLIMMMSFVIGIAMYFANSSIDGMINEILPGINYLCVVADWNVILICVSQEMYAISLVYLRNT